MGDKSVGKGRIGTKGKTVVFGVVERDGDMRAGVIPNARMNTLVNVIRNNVVDGSRISSDEHTGYQDLKSRGYDHHTVNQGKDEWVRGETHTNSIEGHWSQLKRSIRGTHVHVSPKHLWKCVNEFSYRRNMRHSHRAMFDRLVVSLSLPRLAAP
jgi:hypothetical protein